MRVLIVEDDVLLREGLRLIVEGRGHQATCVGDATAASALLREAAPDVLLTDIRLPPSHRDEGIQLALSARERYPELHVLVLSAYVETRYAAELFHTGRAGTGYLLKERIGDVPDFLAALERVGAGGSAIDPDVVAKAFRRRNSTLESLSARERDVLEAVAEGLNNAEIATRLVVTESAVNKHISNIFAKLRLVDGSGNRRVQAVLTYLNEMGT
ncbi:response regulator [Nonomuraea spiralis]|uniref:Response regulator n=1 Tax=Nonomuraea spiralis TaxID=46182 RepID=A0ABV5IYB5_9ACTN|nr:response regulator transcription factor [Nonomuraea spiralis]GGS84695.1 DNA-binding response regulator [Nonomuraea spiralis]